MPANCKILVALLYSACLLFTLNSKGQTVFNTYYQSGSRSAAYKITSIEQNDYLLTSYFNDSLTGQQGLDLRKIDQQGNTIKRKRYLFKDLDFLSPGSNGFQLFLSGSTAFAIGGTGPIVILTSFNIVSLDTNWVKYYSDTTLGFRLSNILKTKTNEFWLFGEAGNNIFGRPYVIKIDSTGNLISTLDITSLSQYSGRRAFFDTTLKLLFFTGENFSVPQTNPQAYVACMDTTGNILWNKPFSSFSTQIEKKNNYLIVSGQKWTKFQGGNNYYKLFLLKLNASNGDIIWQKTYGEELIQNTFWAFTINSDESITSVGAYQYPSYNPIGLNTNGVILKTNANGDSLWMQTYSNHGVGKVETFQDIQPTSDGGYIMCGAPHYADPCHSWVVKTDSMGKGPGMYPVGFDEFQLQEGLTHKVFPNPAKNYIQFDLEYGGLNEVLVFNTLGQMIMHLKDYENNVAVSIENLNSGLYTFIIRQEDKIYTGKFVKE